MERCQYMKRSIFIFVFFSLIIGPNVTAQTHNFSKLTFSSNGHYLKTQDGKPFFWLGDTGWLLFSKLTPVLLICIFTNAKCQEKIIVVAQNGSGNFSTVQQAFNSIREMDRC